MKKLLSIAILSIWSISAHAGEVEKSEPLLWENLYNGDFSLSHKMVLVRPSESTNDDLMSQFMMSYLFYRMGDMEKSKAIFEGIDSYLEYHYFQQDSGK